MNKNTIIAIVALAALAAGILLYMRNTDDSSAFAFGKEKTAIDNWSGDIDVFAFGDELTAETSQTTGDISDEKGSLDSESALDEGDITTETNQADLSQSFSDFGSDKAALQETGQSLNELTQ